MLLYLICFFSAPLSSLLLKPCPNSLFSHPPPLSQYGLGNESSVLGLLWRIKQHFFAAADEISDNVEGDDNNDNSDFNVSPTKQQFLTWLKHRVHFDYQNLRAFLYVSFYSDIVLPLKCSFSNFFLCTALSCFIICIITFRGSISFGLSFRCKIPPILRQGAL